MALMRKLKAMTSREVPKPSQTPSATDPYHAAAVERGRAAVRRLQELGIIDEHGRRVRQDLPADMQDGSDRDFGG